MASLDEKVSFYEVIAAAAKRDQCCEHGKSGACEECGRRGECAIGYRIWSQCHDSEKHYGVKINPKKSDEKDITFEARDCIIVIAQHERDEWPASVAAPDETKHN